MDIEYKNTADCPVKNLLYLIRQDDKTSGFEFLLEQNKIHDIIIDEGDVELF